MKAKVTILSILTLTVVFFSGCTTPVAIDPMTGQQQTAEYRSGYFYAPIAADANDVFLTTIRAIDGMGLLRTGELHKKNYIKIFARQVGDKEVVVRIKQIAAGESEIRIRVGQLGDLPQSQVIYAKIRDAM
ncbi:MAG: hypothetical protein ABS34_07915 [Opitutaceae bacterium BACL24 MAG-120322-bin51]|jgi:hypothetical protein|nr:MAG: hypothetical protein ABS34_07915 [Opitutaceae bacterium BACL24 MAG-120322-bin51]